MGNLRFAKRNVMWDSSELSIIMTHRRTDAYLMINKPMHVIRDKYKELFGEKRFRNNRPKV